MKTSRIHIELMENNQINKELIFNEAMVKIDSFMNLVIEDFVEQEPKNNHNFIITSGENKNKISYMNNNSENRQYFLPTHYIMVFVLKKNDFYIFNQNEWQKLSISSVSGTSKADVKTNPCNDYIGIEGEYDINESSHNFILLYLNGNTKINVSNISFNEITLILKSNWQKSFKLDWSENILWQKKEKPLIGQTINDMNIIKLYKLPEKEGKYLATHNLNYQY